MQVIPNPFQPFLAPENLLM